MKINHTELRSFFYGTLLGDSYIHNNTFYCKQISKDLILFKKKIIEENLPDAKIWVKEYEGYIDKNGVNHQAYYILNVSGSEYIKKLYSIFYPNGKKIIPQDAIKKLTPLGLALWYADDGTTILVQYNNTTGSAKSRRSQICTDSFSKEENLQIIKDFKNIFNINCSLIHRKEEQYRIQFSVKDAQILFCTIGYYFQNYFPSLIYKLDLGYRNESLNNRRYVSEDYHNFYIKISALPTFNDRLKDRMI